MKDSIYDDLIHDDFNKICKFIGLDGFSLRLVSGHNEGFCYRNKKIIDLGVKDGYNRTLLVHECLHGIGYNHNSKNFSGSLKYDKISPMFEHWIFTED